MRLAVALIIDYVCHCCFGFDVLIAMLLRISYRDGVLFCLLSALCY